jgi:hypothetical protein
MSKDTTIAISGASGDLTRRRLVAALASPKAPPGPDRTRPVRDRLPAEIVKPVPARPILAAVVEREVDPPLRGFC